MTELSKLNRIKAAVEVVKKARKGDYSVRIESEDENDEIDLLANEINLLIGKLSEQTNREMIKAALEESDSVLKATIESIQDGVLVVLGERSVSHYNTNFCKMWSIPKSVMETGDDRKLIDYVLPQLINPDLFVNKIKELYQSSETSGDILLLKDGRVFERFSYPLIKESKKRGQAWFFRDITERKQLETALRMTQFCYDRASVGIFRIDKDARILDVNDFTCQYLGYTRDELYEMTVMDLNPTLDPKRWDFLWELMRTRGSNMFETIHKRKDGTIVPVEITANFLEFEGRKFAVSFVKDITERKQATEALHLTRYCFDKASIGIFRIDADGKIMSVNEKACQNLGYTSEELCNLSVFDIDPIFPREGWKTHRNNLLIEGTRSIESIHKRKDGTTFPVEILIDFHEFEGQEFFLSYANDISDRAKTEKENEILQKQLIHAQKMEAVGQLAGGIAHDFNNILQSIAGNSQLLLLDWNEQLLGYDRLKQIEKASLRASDLTRQLLTYSRKIESNILPINFNNEVKQIAEILERTMPKIISIDLSLEDALYDINADPNQIEQIIMNLSLNAQQAMPEGGELYIGTQNATLDQEYCNTHLGAKAGNYAILSITDTGMGIDKITMNRIYEPFYTTKKMGEGSGLGLSMVYGIVKNHGGYIMCYSELGQGTTFKVYFPANVVEHKYSDAEAPVEETKGGTETLLIADDDQAILELAEEMLNRYGYKTITVRTGEEALAFYKAKRVQIDLIILDLNMPGMGGHKCLDELVKFHPAVKVLISSGYAPNGIMRKTMESGAGGFIGKPFQIFEMLKKIRELLDME